MTTNTYQASFQNCPSQSANESNFIKNPQMHYQSNNQMSKPYKTSHLLSPNLNTPSSMNQNYLSVTPKINN